MKLFDIRLILAICIAWAVLGPYETAAIFILAGSLYYVLGGRR